MQGDSTDHEKTKLMVASAGQFFILSTWKYFFHDPSFCDTHHKPIQGLTPLYKR